MPAFAVIGAQWGDEGKGKIVDYLASKADMVVRFSGGNNAGHTVLNDQGEFKLHLVPAGIFWPNVKSIIGGGVVVDPDALMVEISGLQNSGVDTSQLHVSDRAHVVMPYHILLDNLEEATKGDSAIGTTGRGIGPAYVDKAARVGIRIGDLLDPAYLKTRLQAVIQLKNILLTKVYEVEPIDFDDCYAHAVEMGEKLRPYITSTEPLLFEFLREGKKVLLEGAQGALLDLDHGTYPYVTSSSPTIGGAATGLGINPREISGTVGIFKAYSTRVGSGPMPSEILGGIGDRIRELAWEYGTTTGRPRRVGWFDGVAARYSATVNGYTSAVLTRLDVLDGIESVRVCVAYELNGERIDHFPSRTTILEQCVPVYEDLPGWTEPTASARDVNVLPKEAKQYIERLEALIGCPIDLISTGPKREESITVRPIMT